MAATVPRTPPGAAAGRHQARQPQPASHTTARLHGCRNPWLPAVLSFERAHWTATDGGDRASNATRGSCK
eukprot:8218251-Pyramimonas_sp.AAC.1